MPAKEAMQSLYTAIATAPQGREGHTHSQDGQLALTLSLPPPLGEGGRGTNPEELFAASIASCFAGAIQATASERGVETGPIAITVSVSLCGLDQGLTLAVQLEGRLPELEEDAAKALMQAATELCPYTKAIQGNVSFGWVLATAPICA